MTPPYPPETRAKGWRFELDHERIRGSDTWAVAPAEVRPWLLMLWMVAWEQSPCGSLPADDVMIAARIGMTAKAFAKARTALMRGWWKAEDERLYHRVITERVLEMIDYREKSAKRKADYRERMQESQGSHAGQPQDSHGKNDTGTGTGTGTGTLKEKEKAKAPPSLTVEELKAEGLSEETATEFIALRNRKGSKLTSRAWKGVKAEIQKAGWPAEKAIEKCLARGWVSFESEWVKDERQRKADLARSTVPSSETDEQMRARLDKDQMTPEQWASAKKAREIAMGALKNITPRQAA